MNASSETQQVSTGSISSTLQRYLSGRRGLILAVFLLAALATYLGWSWLTAAGIAPILIAFAPCAAMCALGLCMNRMGGKSCSINSQTRGEADGKKS